MTATIEVELGCLITKIDEAITISRKQMDYGWKEVGDTFFRSGTKVPVETDGEYWGMMNQYYPWSTVKGIFLCGEALPSDTKVCVPLELVARITAITGGYSRG